LTDAKLHAKMLPNEDRQGLSVPEAAPKSIISGRSPDGLGESYQLRIRKTPQPPRPVGIRQAGQALPLARRAADGHSALHQSAVSRLEAPTTPRLAHRIWLKLS
jgi:hypothetical protein